MNSSTAACVHPSRLSRFLGNLMTPTRHARLEKAAFTSSGADYPQDALAQFPDEDTVQWLMLAQNAVPHRTENRVCENFGVEVRLDLAARHCPRKQRDQSSAAALHEA